MRSYVDFIVDDVDDQNDNNNSNSTNKNNRQSYWNWKKTINLRKNRYITRYIERKFR